MDDEGPGLEACSRVHQHPASRRQVPFLTRVVPHSTGDMVVEDPVPGFRGGDTPQEIRSPVRALGHDRTLAHPQTVPDVHVRLERDAGRVPHLGGMEAAVAGVPAGVREDNSLRLSALKRHVCPGRDERRPAAALALLLPEVAVQEQASGGQAALGRCPRGARGRAKNGVPADREVAVLLH